MNAATKLGGYALVLAVALGGGAAIGSAAGPIDVGTGSAHSAPTTAPALPAGGLLVSQDGYALETSTRTLPAPGSPASSEPFTFTFTITGPDGFPVTAYDQLHERELHLIVASRDLTSSYLHLHPTRSDDGTWTIDLPRLPSGTHRVFADFQPARAEPITLGIDVVVPGPVEPPLPLRPTDTVTVDGFDVALDLTGETASFTIERDGQPVATEPYLGAAGHLVALRDGDLAYLHVHPIDENADTARRPGAPIRFGVELPSAGTYALFLEFQVDGVVRTAPLAVTVERTLTATPASHDDGGH